MLKRRESRLIEINILMGIFSFPGSGKCVTKENYLRK
jgi:hypothetical protein